MKILSWNVNGLRKLEPLHAIFEILDADILCFQETRISGLYDPYLESLAFVKGYDSFFSICRQKRGYSGVATFCKKRIATPTHAWEGLGAGVGDVDLDLKDGFCGTCNIPHCPCEGNGCPEKALATIVEEGRCVVTDHQRFVLINVYVPAVSVEDRVMFKMHFLHALEAKVCALQASGKNVIVVGDFNICPHIIDCAEPIPKSLLPQWENRPSRQWFHQWLSEQKCDMVDVFRALHPDLKGVYSCWSEATRARQNNHGVRIDLIVASRRLFVNDVQSASVLGEVTGSDHCPVSVTLRYSVLGHDIPSAPPKFCTVYTPRFCYRQQSLKEMFARRVATQESRQQLNNFRDDRKSSLKLRSRGISKSSSSSGVAEKKDIKKRPTRRKQTTFTKIIVPSDVDTKKTDAARVAARVAPPEGSSGNESAENDSTLFRKEAPVHRKVDKRRKETAKAWRQLLTGPPAPPRCRHGLPCVLKTVTKSGENKGRTFFSCPYPAGIGKTANCNFFQWAPFKPGMYIQ